MLLESKNGLLVKFDQYMYQCETYMYIVKQNKNFVTITYQEKNHTLNLEKKYMYMQHWYYKINTWIS